MSGMTPLHGRTRRILLPEKAHHNVVVIITNNGVDLAPVINTNEGIEEHDLMTVADTSDDNLFTVDFTVLGVTVNRNSRADETGFHKVFGGEGELCDGLPILDVSANSVCSGTETGVGDKNGIGRHKNTSFLFYLKIVFLCILSQITSANLTRGR
jgi:hypothetical protein